MSTIFILFCSLASLHSVASQGKPPGITDPLVHQIRYIAAKDSIILTCKAEGNPTPKYTWYRTGTEIASNQYQKVDADTGALEILDFSGREAGDYRCGATNNISLGVSPLAMSPAISLKEIRHATVWTKSGDIDHINASEGEYAKLECNYVTPGDPKLPFSWFLKSSSDADQLRESNRTYIDERGTLHFIYVEPSDKTSGNDVYNCAIHNKVQDYIKLGNAKRLTVKEVTGKPERKPRNQFKTDPAEFQIGHTAELECVFSGYPLPSTQWFNIRNEPINPGGRYQMDKHNMKLKIAKLTEKDEGLYRCKGENTLGEAETTIFLDVKSGPIWEKAITNLTVPEGRDASFTCKARPAIDEKALEPPVWYKNWERIQKTTGNIIFGDEGRVLTVTQPIKPDDIMCFQCQITNDIGSVFSNGCLNVIKPIKVTTQPPLKQGIKKGDLVNLTVRGTTDPGMTLRYRWEFKKHTYYTGLPPHVVYDDATKQTYINTTSLSDEEYRHIEGTYTGVLYHDFETRRVVIDVVLDDGTGDRYQVTGADLDVCEEHSLYPWIYSLSAAVVVLLFIVVFLIIRRPTCTCPTQQPSEAYLTPVAINMSHVVGGGEAGGDDGPYYSTIPDVPAPTRC
ncbi:neural cell adhesion molecule L1-like isoform X1 [Haliotis rufescens]|uniref:neural cell adhesion molecule L1-like isoform X1 n=2 Tax=Haliotis rufescens TaxID=6454 RepID=UPI00201EB4B4|nr:neural cell adhesion molecule L1-like isoform X1 [Haliotis rufescens]